MASGMEQDPVVRPVCTAVCPPYPMMAMPACPLCETLLADGTQALRFLPAAPYLASTLQMPGHTDARTGCKGGFPLRGIRSGRAVDGRVPPHRPTPGAEETDVLPPP
jgi:hypothetical protein